MSTPELSLVGGDDNDQPAAQVASVPIALGVLFPLLVHAYRHDYHWIKDFERDEVLVPRDLAEALQLFEGILEERRRA